eukprot:1878674-Rhodomonas_salina.1
MNAPRFVYDFPTPSPDPSYHCLQSIRVSGISPIPSPLSSRNRHSSDGLSHPPGKRHAIPTIASGSTRAALYTTSVDPLTFGNSAVSMWWASASRHG